ncbi:MAG: HAD family hydrolase [Sarcina sp.]
MINNMKAAIFDLDGTLIDSMGIWVQIDIDYIDEIGHSGKVDFVELKQEINHLSYRGTAEYFKNRFNLDKSVDEICARWHDMAYEKYSKDVKLKEGVFEFLTHLKNSGIKIGLATSNSIELAIACLEANGVLDLFESITITGEVSRGKNFPDVYLLSAQRLGIEPKDIVVFEDIPIALEGAKKGNFKVIGVYDSYCAHHEQEMIAKSDKFIKSYTELLNNF